MALIDTAGKIRTGEELPQKTMETFIRDTFSDIRGEIRIKQFPSGHSNLTYLIESDDRQMVLRCPPRGTKAKSAHDMNREYRILTALHDAYPYCPRPLAYLDDPAVFDRQFYLMERIEGVIIRNTIPEALNFSPGDTGRLFESVLEVQHKLHAIDYEKIGLGNFGRPEGYIRRQVEGWTKRYAAARTPDVPESGIVSEWLSDRMPENPGKGAIIHNDFKFDNVILDARNPFKVVGVLDWEMATLGDPLMDFGCTLGYWVQPGDPEILNQWRDCPTNAPGALLREQMLERYAALSGHEISDFDFYLIFGVFRLAVIVQQIYYRFYNGQSRDERHRSWGQRTTALLDFASDLIRRAS